MPTAATTTIPNDLEAFWMPFTSNRQFKKAPRLMVSAKGMYFTSHDGRQILDGTAGLWCVNAGHTHEKIVAAVRSQVGELDFVGSFQTGHPKSFELANKLTNLAPDGLDHVFFTNSGSEAVDTALKIALAYHRVRGEGTRTRFIGRDRGYHGVGFGGISVGGMVNNRKFFGPLLSGTDHLPHTHNLEHNAFSRGQPEWGAHLADELENLVALHDASTIAAVIVEPVAASTGVLVPPHGYLERLREICSKHGILLIFDEVVTGFGRLGTSFAAQYFDVTPDLITMAKGITSAVVPMGGVIASTEIYDAFMQGPDNAIEFFHGYTYSGHPLASATAIATLEVYEEEGLFQRTAEIASYWEDAVHNLKGLNHIIDLRNLGLMAGIELDSIPNQPGARAFDLFQRCYEAGLLVRATGDTIALSPPLIAEKGHIDELFDILSAEIKNTD
ncbi:MAG: aspartate aminotransferase family protein [Rhodospirillaceae bacterium]|jgi:beta-alanine--pyruvate transaminase|nr:aspartate aminotransferase family protein [Rhodospirillaceae bacterium]MBT5941356.1 aspartate aminotransferase family protein [Rhodospirillaceae bacterium]MBT7956014.1 aspartate aminotransferase family protein [Rhodospirillaceae bacterium]